MGNISQYEQEQQRRLDEMRGRGRASDGQKDYSGYFKIIITLLIIPYIVRLFLFLAVADTYNDISDIIGKLM
ncbi:MAG: hypothetical protein K2P87_12965 [Lachnospiraceae bacterium]|nr:hypothetical protein [Lachnospiraceae bacterium]